MEKFFDAVDTKSLTNTELSILEHFKSHISEIGVLSLDELSDRLYVSNASITRFCKKLGFSGFNEFKFKIRNYILDDSVLNQYTSLMSHKISVLTDFIDSVNQETITQIRDLILKSKYFYVYGRNFSSLPAKYLADILNTMDIRCILIDWIDFLSSLSPSFPSYTLLMLFVNNAEKNIYLPIIENCRKHNVNIVWISNSNIDQALLDSNDIYINTNEFGAELYNTHFKMNSFVMAQIIIESLLRKN